MDKKSQKLNIFKYDNFEFSFTDKKVGKAINLSYLKHKQSSYKVSGSMYAPFDYSIVSNETLTVLNKDLSFKF